MSEESKARQSGRRWGTLFSLLAGLVGLPVYLLTMPPSLSWGHHGADGGDLVSAVARGSIPHPPGFPTYLLLGEGFFRLAGGEPAWRLNLMSAVMAAGAASLTTAAVLGVLARRTAGTRTIEARLVALTTGLALGLAPLFWSQALIAEVYAPAAFFAALVMLLALAEGPPWSLGLAWGLGIGAHPTLLFLAPIVAWRVAHAGAPGRLRGSLEAGLSALLVCGLLYGPVLLLHGGAPSPWGDVSTPAGWWTLISARLYRGYLFGLPLSAWPRRLLGWGGLLARQFTPVGAALAGLGWFRMWQRQRGAAPASLLAFGGVSLYAMGYNTTDSRVYLAPVLPLAAVGLGVGLAEGARWLRGRRSWVVAGATLLLPLLQALLFWNEMDLSEDREATAWARRVLQQAPSRAVILSDRDAHTFTLWYTHDVLGQRPDVVVLDEDMWGQEAYQRTIAATLGLEKDAGDLSPEEAARRTERPIVRAANMVEEESH